MLHRYQKPITNPHKFGVTYHNPNTHTFYRYLYNSSLDEIVPMHWGTLPPHVPNFPNSITGRPDAIVADPLLSAHFDAVIRQFTYLHSLTAQARALTQKNGLRFWYKKQQNIALRLDRLIITLDDLAVSPPYDDIFLKIHRKYSPHGMETR